MRKVSQQILDALKWRYAVKVFDPTKIVDEDLLYTILESGRLSPSALGAEPWKFLVIKNPEVREKLFQASNQSKVKDASHLIVLTYRTDVFENITRERIERTAKIQNKTIAELADLQKMLEDSINKHKEAGTLNTWAMAQVYIPLGIMIYTASLLGVDNGPMEGFDREKTDEILGLKEKNLKSVTMLALGYRGEDKASNREKVRREFDEVIEFI